MANLLGVISCLFFPLTTIFRDVQVYSNNSHNMDAIDLNLGYGYCSHCETMLIITRLSLFYVGVIKLLSIKSTSPQLSLAQMLFCEEILSTFLFVCFST